MPKRIHRLPSVMPAARLPNAQPQKRQYRNGGVFLLLIGCTGLLYWTVFFSRLFRIEKIEIIGPEDTAIQSIAARLAGENIFRLNTAALEQDMRQAYSPIASVSVVRGLPHIVRITITLRQPSLRWQVGDTVFIVDGQGQVFREGAAPEYETLPKIVDKSNVIPKIGQEIVAPAFIQFIDEIQKTIPGQFRESEVAKEITETTNQIDLVFANNLRIRLTTQRPVQEQLTAAHQILGLHPDAQLIDVRVTGRGYWK